MNVVVIGAGRMGRRHIDVAVQSGLRVAGIVDTHSQAAEEAAAPISGAVAYADARQAVAAVRPECVIISTTAPSHAELTCLAAELGAKYIFCEKPMATSLAGCDRMLAACRASGAKLAINHQMRFMEQYTIPKKLLSSEKLGGVTSVNVISGNFGIAMNGTHYVEMFRFIADEPASEVSAWFSSEPVPNPRGAQFEDRAGTIRATTNSGKRFVMDCSADQGHGLTVVYGARYGQIVVDELAGLMRVTARDAEHRDLPTTRYGMPWKEETQKIAPADVLAPTRAVLDAFLAGGDYPTGEEGRAAVATVVAAYVSDESGNKPVRVEDAALPLKREFPWA